MTTSEEKARIIKETYHDESSGYGSLADTWRQAKAKNISITMADVKRVLNAREDRQVKMRHSGQNSFVSPGPRFEIELDVIDLGTQLDNIKGTYRFGLVGIDNFTKKAWVVPMDNKDANNLISATKDIFQNIGKPKQIYSDQEKAMTGLEYTRFLTQQGVKHITSINGAHTVERFNRTLKNMLDRRLRAKGLSKKDWASEVLPIIRKYNSSHHHRIIGMAPNQAEGRSTEVRMKLKMNAKSSRKYPELKVGDNVRYLLTRDNKSNVSDARFSSSVKQIRDITTDHSANGQKLYMLNDLTLKRLYQRHELLKV